MRELQHRVKNILTTIQAVARRTRAKSANLDEFTTAFEGRLAALARTHDLLSRPSATAVSVREILTEELSAHGAAEGESFTQHGPAVLLSPRQAQALSMAFHELATNAVKHGALSAKDGHIDISWTISPLGSEERLRIRWRETRVMIERHPVNRGYGSDILDKSIPQMLKGTLVRTFHPDGIECAIEFVVWAEPDDPDPGS